MDNSVQQDIVAVIAAMPEVLIQPGSKQDIIDKMKIHQVEYSRLNEELKKIKEDEKNISFFKSQAERLIEFKVRYNFFVLFKNDRNTAGTPFSTKEVEPIDWAKVETCLSSTLSLQEGYALGWDETGMPGLGYHTYSETSFQPMVETEDDAKKYLERELKRIEIAARKK
jgi:hypothetical protein